MSPKSTPSPDRLVRFRRIILRWFRRHGRDLPWRRTRDPWAILVSETMLQQTPVSRVTGHYQRFLDRCPTLPSLAASPPARVRELWDGLGYYRRAANLHALAVQVVRDHQGTLPTDPVLLQQLPGIGRYTAGAVASFAHEQAVPAVDTNVARVIRRAFHPRTGHDARGVERIWATAEALLPRGGTAAWTFNQGIMELGARVCTARRTPCESCPVRSVCSTGQRRLSGAGSRRAAREDRECR